ncbi:MAG: hypothetical protein QXO40_03535 [Candidatus Aenigmatarchaeota archaeon]
MVLRGALINVLSFSHPHIKSLLTEGLWGFPEDKLGLNKKKWNILEIGTHILLYSEYAGVKGIWFLCEMIEKFENRNPVSYWIQNPLGYPWQIRLKPIFPYRKFELDVLGKIKPIHKDELASIFGIKIFRAKLDRWSLMLFSEVKEPLINYNYSLFKKIKDEFEIRNKGIVLEKPEHESIKEAIYQIGFIQNKFPQKEYPINGKLLDVIWRRTAKSVPSVAFEVQIGGNIFEALSKLKHAFDLWNSIPVLVTTSEQIDEAKRWIEGSFHELKDVFRLLTWEEIKEYYNIKREAKNFEMKLKLA